MKHYFDGILRRIYKPSKKFFIKSPYDMGHIRIYEIAPTPLRPLKRCQQKIHCHKLQKKIGSHPDRIGRLLKNWIGLVDSQENWVGHRSDAIVPHHAPDQENYFTVLY
jgi:hypothetical protein